MLYKTILALLSVQGLVHAGQGHQEAVFLREGNYQDQMAVQQLQMLVNQINQDRKAQGLESLTDDEISLLAQDPVQGRELFLKFFSRISQDLWEKVRGPVSSMENGKIPELDHTKYEGDVDDEIENMPEGDKEEEEPIEEEKPDGEENEEGSENDKEGIETDGDKDSEEEETGVGEDQEGDEDEEVGDETNDDSDETSTEEETNEDEEQSTEDDNTADEQQDDTEEDNEEGDVDISEDLIEMNIEPVEEEEKTVEEEEPAEEEEADEEVIEENEEAEETEESDYTVSDETDSEVVSEDETETPVEQPVETPVEQPSEEEETTELKGEEEEAEVEEETSEEEEVSVEEEASVDSEETAAEEPSLDEVAEEIAEEVEPAEEIPEVVTEDVDEIIDDKDIKVDEPVGEEEIFNDIFGEMSAAFDQPEEIGVNSENEVQTKQVLETAGEAEMTKKTAFSILSVDLVFLVLGIVGFFMDKQKMLVCEKKFKSTDVQVRHSRIQRSGSESHRDERSGNQMTNESVEMQTAEELEHDQNKSTSMIAMYFNTIKLYTSSGTVFFSNKSIPRPVRALQLNAKIFINLAFICYFLGAAQISSTGLIIAICFGINRAYGVLTWLMNGYAPRLPTCGFYLAGFALVFTTIVSHLLVIGFIIDSTADTFTNWQLTVAAVLATELLAYELIILPAVCVLASKTSRWVEGQIEIQSI